MQYGTSTFMKVKSKGWICDMSFYWANLDLEFEEVREFPIHKDYVNIHTALGVVQKPRYSNWMIFDTIQERDAFKAALLAERAESAHRNKIIQALVKELKELETEYLEEIIDQTLKMIRE